MIENSSFRRSVDLLHRNLAVTTLRREVIANNVANAETPNFKRSDVNFEAELSRALATEKNSQQSKAHLTHKDHIPFQKIRPYQEVKPRVMLDYLTSTKNNGNNVDIEQEMLQVTENQMAYELMSKALTHQFRQIDIVLK